MGALVFDLIWFGYHISLFDASFFHVRVKFVTEMVAALLNPHDGVQLVYLCDQQLRQKTKRGEPRQSVMALVTQALTRLLGAQQTMESTDLPPLLRACETLGKFLIHRYCGCLLVMLERALVAGF